MAQPFPDFGCGCGDSVPQQEKHDQCAADIEHHLHQIAPDHRIEPAEQREDDAEHHQHRRGDQYVLRLDIQEDNHRNRDRREIEPRPARQHAPDQIHPRRRAPRRPVEPLLEQLINRGHAKRIIARDQQPRDKGCCDDRGEIAGEVAPVATIAVIRRTQKGRGGLHRRQRGNRDQPGGRMMPSKEIVIGLVRIAPRRPPGRERQQRNIKPEHRPVITRICKRHPAPSPLGGSESLSPLQKQA